MCTGDSKEERQEGGKDASAGAADVDVGVGGSVVDGVGREGATDGAEGNQDVGSPASAAMAFGVKFCFMASWNAGRSERRCA